MNAHIASMTARQILSLPHVAQNLGTMPSAERAALWLSEVYTGVSFKAALKAIQKQLDAARGPRSNYALMAERTAQMFNMSWVQAMCTLSAADLEKAGITKAGAA